MKGRKKDWRMQRGLSVLTEMHKKGAGRAGLKPFTKEYRSGA